MHTVTYHNKDRALKAHTFDSRDAALRFARSVTQLQVSSLVWVQAEDAWTLPIVVRG